MKQYICIQTFTGEKREYLKGDIINAITMYHLPLSDQTNFTEYVYQAPQEKQTPVFSYPERDYTDMGLTFFGGTLFGMLLNGYAIFLLEEIKISLSQHLLIHL